MPRHLNRLTARGAALAGPGRHADGGNLYLAVSASGAKSWLLIYRAGGRQREMGLGSFTVISLAEARRLASQARLELAAGRDPLEERAKKPARPLTFGEAAVSHVEAMRGGWRNAKHAAQWSMTLKTYSKPIWTVPVAEVGVTDVLAALRPIWTKKAETASRLRGRIEAVLDSAKALGLRAGENPARWRSNLDQLLPKPTKLARGHHRALPYKDVPEAFARISALEGEAAAALAFLILTAARSGEVIGALRQEVDLDASLWTVPATRMKAARPHRVPLSSAAVAIVKSRSTTKIGYIFGGRRKDKPLSSMALEMILRRLSIDATPHGFRSSFRDWAGEETDHAREVAEAALAHVIGDETERAYRRGDALEKRRKLMTDWAAFVLEPQPPPRRLPR